MEKDAQREQNCSKGLRLPCHLRHMENLTSVASRRLVGELVMLFGKLLLLLPRCPYPNPTLGGRTWDHLRGGFSGGVTQSRKGVTAHPRALWGSRVHWTPPASICF